MRADPLLRCSAALAALTVLAQVAYPLTPDHALGALSVGTVVLACSAGLAHAWALHGARWTARVAAVVVVGAFAAEAVGVATGFPFGHYTYAHSLGPLVLGVPLLVPLAWLMMAYPCLVLARTLLPSLPARLAGGPAHLAVAVLAGAAMAAWDVFLDPQLVAAGHWTWRHPSPHLPGVDQVPLTNQAGWLVVGVGLLALVDRAGPADPTDPTDPRSTHRRPGPRDAAFTPALLLGWAWVGGIVGNAVFFDRPWVALWGGLALGAFVLPYLLTVLGVRTRWRG